MNEVNRSYWALYYSRAYYILIQELVGDTREILAQLEQRSDLDALLRKVERGGLNGVELHRALRQLKAGLGRL